MTRTSVSLMQHQTSSSHPMPPSFIQPARQQTRYRNPGPNRCIVGVEPIASGATMPWYIWLMTAAAFGSVLGSLLMLRDTAHRMPIDPEALERMKQRNAELEAAEQQDND